MFSIPTKKIYINIPENEDPPQIIAEFSPEENIQMLKIGGDAVLSSRKLAVSMSLSQEASQQLKREYETKIEDLQKSLDFQQKLIETNVLHEEEKVRDEVSKILSYQQEKYDYIERHNKEEIENLRTQILQLKTTELDVNSHVEREINTKLHENVNIYEKTIEKYENIQRIHMEETHKMRELVDKHNETTKSLYEKLSFTEKELEKYKSKCDNVLSETNYRVEKEMNEKLKTEYEKLKETIEGLSKRQTNNVSLGDKGENIFEEYALKTFRDFDDFNLENVSTKYYKGDFHLHFKRFSIMVDTKYYSNGIDKTQRDKIKRDMQQNQHIKFGWIVSLDTSIQKYNKAPFQFEWTTDNRCICYINQFLKQDDPCEIMRALWFSCNLIFDVAMDNETEQNEIRHLKKNEQRIKEIVDKLLKLTKERDLTLAQFKENFEMTDKCIREILNTEINNVFEEHHTVVYKWWENRIAVSEGKQLTMNKIYREFKKDEDNIISEDYFKTIVYGFVEEKDIIKPKTKNGKVEVLNITWK